MTHNLRILINFRTTILFLFMFMTGTFNYGYKYSFEDSPSLGRITLNISNIKQSSGEFLIAIFNSKDGFPDNSQKAIKYWTINSSKPKKEKIDLGVFPFGTYAIAVLHDTDGNRKMTYNLFGYPKENFGTSNDNAQFLKKPDFETSSFILNKNLTDIEIKLR